MPVKDLLAELRHRAWLAVGLLAALAAACASMRLAFPTAAALMAAGAVMMWKSEEAGEEQPSMEAMLAKPDVAAPGIEPEPPAAPVRTFARTFKPAA